MYHHALLVFAFFITVWITYIVNVSVSFTCLSIFEPRERISLTFRCAAKMNTLTSLRQMSPVRNNRKMAASGEVGGGEDVAAVSCDMITRTLIETFFSSPFTTSHAICILSFCQTIPYQKRPLQ